LQRQLGPEDVDRLAAAGLNEGVEESRLEGPTEIGYWFESARRTYGRKKVFRFARKLKKETR
jgi:hypothetical protein